MYELKNDEKKFNLASLEIVVKNKFRWKFPTKINEVKSGRQNLNQILTFILNLNPINTHKNGLTIGSLFKKKFPVLSVPNRF